MAAMFMALMLKRIAYRDVTVSNNYPDLERDETFDWPTNAM
jgi:hypothetical protein